MSMFDDFGFQSCMKSITSKSIIQLKRENIIGNKKSGDSKYEPFKNHLRNVLLPYIRMFTREYKVAALIKYALRKYPDGFTSGYEKYPDFDFDYESIQRYSREVFKKIEEKVEYYLNIIQSFNRMFGYNDIIPDDAITCIPQLRVEVENYKEMLKVRNINKDNSEKTIKLDITGFADEFKQAIEPLTKQK